MLPPKKSSALKNIHKANPASSFKFILLKMPFVWNSYHVFTKPLPLLDNNTLQITNECSCISLLIVTCSQAVKPHGLLIMPDPQMEVCSTIKFHTLSVSFLISEWVMSYICRAELHFLVSKSIYSLACRCQFRPCCSPQFWKDQQAGSSGLHQGCGHFQESGFGAGSFKIWFGIWFCFFIFDTLGRFGWAWA